MEQRTVGELEPTLIHLARQGDAQAFAQLVQRYQAPVYNLAYRMLGDAAEAEDAAQETFLRAYLQLKSYQMERKFAPWLLSITTHYCIDRLRRSKHMGPSLDADDTQELLISTQPEPEESALARERTEDAQSLLNQLPPVYRAVVVLRYWNELSVEEIARATHDSVGAVKVKLFRARQMMARASQSRPDRFQKPVRSDAQEGALTHAR
jgi:RNA polymerase sigma-70 factor (ECF subfamily)